VFEQEIHDFPGVCDEKTKGDAESAEKNHIMEIRTPSLDYSPQSCPPTTPKSASFKILAFQSSDH
jgi:hypothetical protein